jgi:transcription-repair coupling factor (superfamily II helicase)
MSPAATPSLALQALLKSAARRTGLLDETKRVQGLTAPAKALYAAASCATRPVILIVATDRDVEQMVADARFFVASMEGLSAGETERVVLPFPSQEVDPYRGLHPHFDVASARARALHALATGQARLVVASAAALLPTLSPPERLTGMSVELTLGGEIAPPDLRALLARAGFTPEDPVDEHGEYCVRGGVVDFFPAGDAYPVRVEFIGDTIESIRRFDPATQRSVATLDHVAVIPLRELATDESPDGAPIADRSASFFDYCRRPGTRIVLSEESAVDEQGERIDAQVRASFVEASARGATLPPPEGLIVGWAAVQGHTAAGVRLEELGVDAGDEAQHDGTPARHVACQPTLEFRGRLHDWVADIRRARERDDTVVFVVGTSGRAERTIELLREYDLLAVSIDRAETTRGMAVLVAQGRLSRGFRLPDANLVLVAEADVFDEDRQRQDRRKSATGTFLSDFRDLKKGDVIVHVDHGVGLFVGLKTLSVGVETQEFMELRYAGEDKLFVPVERLDLVQRYSGVTKPPLDRLGGTSWEKTKTRVKKAMRDMADELLKLYAARKAVKGHAFSPDTHWQEEFEGAFEYDLTPDQHSAITDIKKDMESVEPMDRLLCGDVGYGKTEVAMRAAFKVVMDGKQVAVLAPTTVLAFQHLKTFTQRFAEFPVRIDMISRFRTKAEQKATVEAIAQGKVDIVVGTHRLLSKDVQFHDLGLLVVDEEQRFGVTHKERIKQMRKRVDVLTLTATPIPRTLNMSLVGIRDMSVIETPPRDRLSIQTNVVKFDQRVLASAIRNELQRGGQVYVVHNRVESIYSMGNLLHRLVPEAKIGIGHGQMTEDALERVMVDFVARKFDVLLATTIIENGLDIPNANTIVVNRADRYGLAQLYQLRGRVGRSDRRAYAYLLIPPEGALSPVAKKRLAAIKEFSDLGSGFRVAALDLEIRGAGNLLGGEQSGHIEAIGFEMYMKLLEETVRELKGEDLEDELRATVNLKVDLRIEDDYIPDMNQRLSVYRRIAAARHDTQLDEILAEVRDRYGPPPASLLNLEGFGRLRIAADRLRVESIEREGNFVSLKFRERANVDPVRLMNLLKRRTDLQLVPPSVLRLSLVPPIVAPRHGHGHPRPAGTLVRTKRTPAATPLPGASSSWWTARATTGEVAPGFSKQEILKELPPDPRAPGGLYERIGGVLEELRDS